MASERSINERLLDYMSAADSCTMKQEFQRSRSERPRVLFLNRSYWPDSEATGQLLTTLCEGLVEQFEVHVLAGKPNSAADADWQQATERNGVTIHRVAHTTFSKRRMSLKALNFLSFIRSATRHLRRIPPPDIVVFETDPFLLPFVARRLQRQTGCQVIGYLQDIYPDVAIALGKVKNRWAIRKLRTSLFSFYRKCDRMIVLSRDMQDLLVDGGIEHSRIRIIPNWADTSVIRPIGETNLFVQKYQLHGKFVVMYSGNLGLTQRLEEFVDAAALLRDDSQIQFVLIGQGARKADLQQQAKSHGLQNVLFLDYQPLAELGHSLSAADLHLLPLSGSLARCLMPSKLYGILAAGRPYLTNAPVGTELHELTVQHRLGLTVQAGSAGEIATAIKSVVSCRSELNEMGNNGRRLAEARFTPHHSLSAFRDVLSAVLAERTRC